MTDFDFTPLRSRVSPKDTLRGFFEYNVEWFIGVGVGILLIAAALITAMFLALFGKLSIDGGVFLVFLFACGAYTVMDVLRLVVQTQRLKWFATINNCEFKFDSMGLDYVGTYFANRQVLIVNAIRTKGSQFFEFGNFRLVGNQERSSMGSTFGYIRIKLPRRLPHILLKSTRNRMPLPLDIDSEQALGLEGDFHKYFRLYVPNGYKRDALYIFTPDVMALFIDMAGAFSCELIDNELYLYSSRKFELERSRQIEKIVALVDTMTRKLDHQIDYYKDDRIISRAANLVARPGRRLRDSWLSRSRIFDIVEIILLALVTVYVFIHLDGNNMITTIIASLLVAVWIAGIIRGVKRTYYRMKARKQS